MNQLTKFKVGDEVRAYGLKGSVTRIVDGPYVTNTIRVCFDDGFDQWFTSEGKADPRHKEPVLELISKPKRKVNKTLYLAVALNPIAIGSRLCRATSAAYESHIEAEGQFLSPNQIVQVVIEVEE